jgi:hypothetical protein
LELIMARKTKSTHVVVVDSVTVRIMKDEKRYSISGWGLTDSQIDAARQAGYKRAKKLDGNAQGGAKPKDMMSEEQRTILDSIVDICHFDDPRMYQKEARKAWVKRFAPEAAPSLSRDQLRASLARVLASRK